ncbi:hypothetical protein ACHHYP_10217 [Achlya hypogyna]|uniref:Beta-lactamase-related domain-containing protein n=1 Tax=Achlya hypogyna TaxID=1202772 RepID=A0A1V9ZIE2_ACHHY|nr:hypothetical protein ACHHYP_10217 [Achlya hypogyna]
MNFPIGIANHLESLPASSPVDAARELLQRYMKDYNLPGLAVSVVAGGDVVLAEGFGTQRIDCPSELVASNTLFEIGSVSKVFIALGIGILVDQGKAKWDDSVKTHLPWFQLQDKDAEMNTTLTDLLAMRSVLGASQGDIAWTFGVFDSERSIVERLAALDTTGRTRTSGFAYANANYEVLGQVLEAVSGQCWPEFLRENVWIPLEMHDTVGHVYAATTGVAKGHFNGGDRVLGPYDIATSPTTVLMPGTNCVAAGSVLSTAADMAKVVQFLLGDGHPLFASPSILAKITTRHERNTRFSPVAATAWGYAPPTAPVHTGLGFTTIGDIVFGQKYAGKNGLTVAFSTELGLLPDAQVGVAVMANARAMGGPMSNVFCLSRLHTQLLGIFLHIPDAELRIQEDAAIAAANELPDVPCDDHYFGDQPWGSGETLPIATKKQLVGTYKSSHSPEFYGDLDIFLEDKSDLDKSALMLRYGKVTAPLLATDKTDTLIWAAEFALQTILFTLELSGDGAKTISGLGLRFVPSNP